MTYAGTKQGTWRDQVRRNGKYASCTFAVKSLADEWAIETERLIDQGSEPFPSGLWPTRIHLNRLPDLADHLCLTLCRPHIAAKWAEITPFLFGKTG